MICPDFCLADIIDNGTKWAFPLPIKCLKSTNVERVFSPYKYIHQLDNHVKGFFECGKNWRTSHFFLICTVSWRRLIIESLSRAYLLELWTSKSSPIIRNATLINEIIYTIRIGLYAALCSIRRTHFQRGSWALFFTLGKVSIFLIFSTTFFKLKIRFSNFHYCNLLISLSYESEVYCW